MFLAQFVEDKCKFVKQREEKITIFARIIKNTEESCKFISWDKPKVGEPWNPEAEKEKAPKRTTRRKKTTTKKTAKKSTTKKKK